MKDKIKRYVSNWEKNCYHGGIPDEAPRRLEQLNKVPSYRAICFAIMRNDFHLESLGYSKPKTLLYSELKRVELTSKGKITQLRLPI